MADYDTGKDIAEDALSRAGELNLTVADYAPEIKRYILRAYWDICGEFPWLWAMLQPPLQFTTVAEIDVTATVTKGSTSVTLAADPGAVTDRKFYTDREQVPIRISSVAGVTLTLAAAYPYDSGSGLAAHIFQDEYVTATDIMLPVSLSDLAGKELDIISVAEMSGRFPRPSAGISRYAAFVTNSIIRLQPWSGDERIYELRYTKLPAKLDFTGAAATDTPIVPISDRWIIADRALYYLLQDLDDARADRIVQHSALRLAEMKNRQLALMKLKKWVPVPYRLGVSR